MRANPTPIVSTSTPFPTQNATILYSDDFSSIDSGWSRQKKDGYLLSYSDGRYLVIAAARPKGSITIGQPGKVFDNAVIAVDVQIPRINNDNANAVIAWRIQDPKNYYALLLSSDGYVSVRVLEEGQWKNTLYDWTKPENTSPQADTYHVDIAYNKSKSTIFINGTLLTSITDTQYEKGDIGLGSLAGADKTAEAIFDNITVYDVTSWQPPTK